MRQIKQHIEVNDLAAGGASGPAVQCKDVGPRGFYGVPGVSAGYPTCILAKGHDGEVTW